MSTPTPTPRSSTPRSPTPRADARPEDEEAARLLEVGLGTPTTPGRTPPPPPEEVAGWFPELEILDVLGQGGMGVVYKARQRVLDRIVALKVLPQALSQDPAFAERFTREARTLARLQHPHIVGVHEFGDVDGRYYLLMEYVDGVNLRQLMDTESLSAEEALAIVPQVCEALQYAHDQGIVHRDVKPENVLLDRAGNVKVADFGLAKLTQRGPTDFTLTGTGQVMGTLHYMAPEQYRTPQDVDHRADIFSLGVVFYEMLTGELPVGRFVRPSEARGLDTRIDQIVMKTLERERERRYQQAGEIRSEVATLHGAPRRAPGGAPPPPPLPAFETFTPPHGTSAWDGAHPASHDGSEAPPTARRWSRWAVAAPIVLVVCLVLVPIAYQAVFELSVRGNRQGLDAATLYARRDFHGTVAAAWTGLVGMCCSTLVALVATIVTTRHRREVKGRPLAVATLLLSALLVLVALLASALQIERSAAPAFGIGPDAPPSMDPVRVEGASDYSSGQAIKQKIFYNWQRYTDRVRSRDLSVEDTSMLYERGDWLPLTGLSAAELESKRAERALGLPLVGKEQLPVPPWSFRIRHIQIEPWERRAVVRAEWTQDGSRPDAWTLAQTPDGRTEWRRVGGQRRATLTFRMKRSETMWVFEVAPVELETFPPRAEPDGDAEVDGDTEVEGDSDGK